MYKFIDERGHEVTLSDAHEWLSAVRSGRVSASTLVFDSSAARWRKAEELSVFQVALASSGPHVPLRDAEAAQSREPATDNVTELNAATKETHGDDPESPSHDDVSPPSLEVATRHGWQGVLYYSLTYFGAGVVALAAMAVPLIYVDEGGSGSVAFLIFIFGAGLAWFSFFLARGVQRFEPWARIVALVLAYPSALAGLVSMFHEASGGGERLGGMLSMILSIVFIEYFHRKRDTFVQSNR